MAARPVPALIRGTLGTLALVSVGAVVVGAVPVAGAAPASPAMTPQVDPGECPAEADTGGADAGPSDAGAGAVDAGTSESDPEASAPLIRPFGPDQVSPGSGGGDVRIVIEIVIDLGTGVVGGDPVVEDVDAGGADVESADAGGATTTTIAPEPTCAGPEPEPPQPAPQDCLPPDVRPSPGQTVCFSEDLPQPLEITTGGTEGAPVRYRGNGIEVPGIRVNADHVVVEGFVSRGAAGTGIEVSGGDITVQDNQVTQVRYAGDDLDGIRFFGDGIQLIGNHVFDLEGSADIGGSHVDCMQTFATSGPGSSDIVIRGNRCDQIRSQCLMAEGPHDEGGSGEGESRNWLFDGNRCDSHAEAQSVALEDIQDVTISNNDMVGTGNKAFALGAGTTGTVVRDNRIGPGYGREVGFDDPSAAAGYDGPPAE